MNSPQTVFRHSDIGPVPRDWQDVLFADIFEEYDERVSDTDQYPLFSLTIEEGVVPKTSRYERSFLIKKEEENYRIVHPNDFVYNPMNLRFGALARYKGEKPVCVSAYYDVFRAKKGFNSIYFEAFLTSYPMICYYNRMATGSLIEKQRVHFSQFCQFQLPVPSLPEQQKIAEILSACERVLTLKKELKAQKIKQKKWLVQKLLNPVSGVRLPGFKENWEKSSLGKRVKTFSGGTPRRDCPTYYGGDIPWIKSGELNLLRIKKTEEYITEEGLVNSSAKLVKPGTLLLALYGATAGVLAISEIEAAINQAILALIPDLRLSSTFLFYYLSYIVPEAVKLLSQGAQPNLNAEVVKNLQISYPPLAEQSAIAEVLSAADRELDLLEEEIQAWERKKKALSQLLLRGIVRV